ncbi:hypothetical protein L1987_60866 [Smallanthus sonchifolius]|uniref:Uncharacterized protein n=1 Tax=Smallanthus sonchifolius TaxID=185202 RepID=A0ACB9D9G9_9ASTR|nr:hypothetical protein L1987_60866 [Smallanthus sonchifolius]
MASNLIRPRIIVHALVIVCLVDPLLKILRVEKTASQQEIKKAYHKLALRLHPNKNLMTRMQKKSFNNCRNLYQYLVMRKNRPFMIRPVVLMML